MRLSAPKDHFLQLSRRQILLLVFHDLHLSAGALEKPTCKQSAALLLFHLETSPVSVSDMSSGPCVLLREVFMLCF